ncbi:hypothetical protein THRCLA_22403 [Thraustotheca clavata]|uniref:Bzip transcription factor n=1 Tax=Thraustotheca clavata TaxID=74557 RepID=A0A1V9Z2G5_9STRA|nr:hypothetical protein THRCLA_22403 [Thraustotheca clavata]
MDKITARSAQRRAQSRINQRRYRASQKRADEELEKQVIELSSTVSRYEGKVVALRSAVLFGERELKVTMEYFKTFADGYLNSNPSMAKFQRNFLRSNMKEDLIFLGQVGIKKLFQQWRLYDSLFHSFNMECQNYDIVYSYPTKMVHCPATLFLRISRVTIQALYPNILNDEYLVQKLVGQVLRLPVLCLFYFDQDGKITQFDTIADMVGGHHELLKNISSTLIVLDGIRINSDAELLA